MENQVLFTSKNELHSRPIDASPLATQEENTGPAISETTPSTVPNLRTPFPPNLERAGFLRPTISSHARERETVINRPTTGKYLPSSVLRGSDLQRAQPMETKAEVRRNIMSMNAVYDELRSLQENISMINKDQHELIGGINSGTTKGKEVVGSYGGDPPKVKDVQANYIITAEELCKLRDRFMDNKKEKQKLETEIRGNSNRLAVYINKLKQKKKDFYECKVLALECFGAAEDKQKEAKSHIERLQRDLEWLEAEIKHQNEETGLLRNDNAKLQEDIALFNGDFLELRQQIDELVIKNHDLAHTKINSDYTHAQALQLVNDVSKDAQEQITHKNANIQCQLQKIDQNEEIIGRLSMNKTAAQEQIEVLKSKIDQLQQAVRDYRRAQDETTNNFDSDKQDMDDEIAELKDRYKTLEAECEKYDDSFADESEGAWDNEDDYESLKADYEAMSRLVEEYEALQAEALETESKKSDGPVCREAVRMEKRRIEELRELKERMRRRLTQLHIELDDRNSRILRYESRIRDLEMKLHNDIPLPVHLEESEQPQWVLEAQERCRESITKKYLDTTKSIADIQQVLIDHGRDDKKSKEVLQNINVSSEILPLRVTLSAFLSRAILERATLENKLTETKRRLDEAIQQEPKPEGQHSQCQLLAQRVVELEEILRNKGREEAMSPPRQGRKSLYKSKCSDHELILVKNERLKNLAVDKSSNEESESQNLSFQLAALQSSHTTLQESHATLQRSHSDCQELVKTYENHIDGITATNEAQRQHYNNAILNMNSEMARMQRDFNDHLPTNNPDWYKTSALQESIIRLRRETIQSRRVNEELNSRLERTVAEYQEVVDLLSNQQKYHYYHPNTNIITTKPGKQARFESIEEEEERKRKLAAVEEQQKRIRRDDEALEALIERARKWKLGKHYPPERKGWQEQVEKSAWERWEGMTWLEEASEEDRNEAVRLGLWVP